MKGAGDVGIKKNTSKKEKYSDVKLGRKCRRKRKYDGEKGREEKEAQICGRMQTRVAQWPDWVQKEKKKTV